MSTPGVALFCFALPLPHHAQKLFLLTFLEVTKEKRIFAASIKQIRNDNERRKLYKI